MDGFSTRLLESARRAGSWLCVGLDPDPDHYPEDLDADDTLEYCLGVVAATADVACAIKPNAAFFEALGPVGHEALAALLERVPPGLPVILDGKRNDIGHTAGRYAEAAFDELGADAVTVTPYLGRDTVEPFASYEDRGVFVLARTSNRSAAEFQDLPTDGAGTPLFLAVARKAMEWNAEWGNIGLVAGATYPDDLVRLRTLCGDGVPFLIPGVGAQGADAAEALQRGSDGQSAMGIVSVGRGILRAGETPADAWQDAVALAAQRYADALAFR